MFTETLAERGCLVIQRLFPPELIDAVRGEYERQYARLNPADLPSHLNVGDRRVLLPMALRGPLFDPALYANPLLMTLLTGLFQTPFLIDNVSCVTALAGAADQRPHRDHPPLFREQPGLAAAIPAYAVTVAIPLIDLDETTGTTRLLAGSMAMDPDDPNTPPEAAEEVRPFVPRGGCFVMDYRLLHHGLANRSDRDRPILYIVYAREWFTDIINFRKHSRLLVDAADLARIPTGHRAMFRRLAAPGLHDLSIRELIAAADEPPDPRAR